MISEDENSTGQRQAKEYNFLPSWKFIWKKKSPLDAGAARFNRFYFIYLYTWLLSSALFFSWVNLWWEENTTHIALENCISAAATAKKKNTEIYTMKTEKNWMKKLQWKEKKCFWDWILFARAAAFFRFFVFSSPPDAEASSALLLLLSTLSLSRPFIVASFRVSCHCYLIKIKLNSLNSSSKETRKKWKEMKLKWM